MPSWLTPPAALASDQPPALPCAMVNHWPRKLTASAFPALPTPHSICSMRGAASRLAREPSHNSSPITLHAPLWHTPPVHSCGGSVLLIVHAPPHASGCWHAGHATSVQPEPAQHGAPQPLSCPQYLP